MSHQQPELVPATPHGELPTAALRWRADTSLFDFATTTSLEPIEGVIGQRRALDAMEIGAEIASPGYNIFVSGLSGTGRLTTIKNILDRMQTEKADLYDLGYVNNFSDPDRPCVIRLPKGRVRALRADMKDAMAYLRSRIPALFEDEKFRKGRHRIVERFQERERNMVMEFEQKIKPQGFILGQRQNGTVTQPEIVPLVDGAPHPIEELEGMVREKKLTVEQGREINEKFQELQEDLFDLMKRGRVLAHDYQRKMIDFERGAVTMIVSVTLEEIAASYPYGSVKKFLREVRNDILENLDLFKPQRENILNPRGENQQQSEQEEIEIGDPFHIYDINILLNNTETTQRPVIIERNPTFVNLFGTIERSMDEQGGWVSDFSSIKAGSILQADGGYLIINALDALSEPGVWKMMKRVLLHRKIQIQPLESIFQSSGQVSTAMKPEEIRSNVKVIMIGPPELYQGLFHMEEDFRKIFKINAQFDYEIHRTDDLLLQYARFIRKLTEEEELLPFDPQGVAAIIEYAVERAGGMGKISLRFSDIADILREASFWAQRDQSAVVSRRHVDKALAMMVDRNSMWKEKVIEQIDEGTLMIDITGKRIGQINGLAVYDLGQVSFGKPTRITATVSVGQGGILNIEREARLSGSVYNKGTLILIGFFRNRFAQDQSLSFSASIVFEQSYGGIDGDSASSTEVYALLSALSGVPIRQDLSVTGSVNQWGEIQPIGGVKEKIEGFYDVCCRRELTGTQGVLIPIQNVPELMLREDVVAAVAEGKFHIYAVSTIDQGIEILTGIAAGERDQNGHYPAGTINGLVEGRLRTLADKLRKGFPYLLGESTSIISTEVSNTGSEEG